MTGIGRDREPEMSYEAFLTIARQEGIDVSDREDLARLHAEVLGVLRDMTALAALDVGPMEPADVYRPGSEEA